MAALMMMFVGLSVLMIVLAVPMIKRWLKPNPIYGFRILKVMKNPDLWYPVNARFGWWMVVTGVMGLMLSVLPLIFDMSEDAYAMLYAVVLTIPLTYGIIDSFMFIRQLEREAGER